MNPPKRISIMGEEKSLDAVVDGFAGIEKAIDFNQFQYTQAWEEFVPPMNGGERAEFHVAYRPLVCMRKTYANRPENEMGKIPYFVLIVNLGRDKRPHTPKKEPKSDSHEDNCPVCVNILQKDMIIGEFENFWVTPNGFPYHFRSSLLLDKDTKKEQDNPTVEDLSTWMKFSILTNQCVFYNTFGAGATIKHQHAQVVDPTVLKSDGRPIPYPLLTAKRELLQRGVERVQDYPVDAVVFSGRDAPDRAHHLYKRLLRKGHKYNMMINGREIIMVGRNPFNETSACIGKNVGSYELLGVFLLGNIEEPILQRADVERVVEGSEIFNLINYERLQENIEFCTVNLSGFLEEWTR